LTNTGTALDLVIEDDGVGFDPEADYSGHLGLKSMRERAEALGGSLSIDSRPGGGSRIQVSVPAQTGLASG
jgi:signal transduction histidine kinase